MLPYGRKPICTRRTLHGHVLTITFFTLSSSVALIVLSFPVRLEDEDDAEFNEAVSKYPSSFDLELDCLPTHRLQTVLDALIGKLDNGFVLVNEEIQVYNLISYLSFKLGKVEVAFDYNKKALKKDRRNGIALANRARYNKFQLNYFDAEKDLDSLERLYSNDNAAVTTKLVAQGEIAQAYARFGPKFHEVAISKYESLFQNCSHVQRDVVTLWKYDYCLCLRRTLNLFNKTEYPDRDPTNTLRKACATLVEIIDSTANLPAYTARAWAELGQMVYQIEKSPDTFGPHMLETIPIQKRYTSSQIYFSKALECGNRDFDTIEVCAKFMRYFGMPEDSVHLFERALVLRQTSLAYHHMALSLKNIELKKVNEQKRQNQPWRPRHPGYGRGRRNLTQTPRQREQSNMKRSIKCGRNATLLPWNERTKKILDSLVKAYEKDPFNHFAVYDKAFVLRQLSRTQDAKIEFCQLLNRLEIGELKISCYEQAGYCCLDIAEANSRESEKYRFDGIRFLQKAIEVAAAVAAKVKYSSADVRPLIPTVKSMLVDPGLWETNNKQLQRLQNLLLEHGKLLPIVQEASSDKTSEISTLLEKCLHADQVDDAALLSILEEIVSEPNENKFSKHLTTILDNASTYLANGEHESALTMYQIFYRLMGLRMYEENREYDAFLMTDQESENVRPMDQIANWLKNYCGLNVINSDEHCAFGQRILHALTEFSLSSVAVFLVLKDKKIDHLVEMVATSIISMQPETPERKPKLVILKDEAVKLPPAWVNVPTVILPKSQENVDSEISTWLAKLFKAVIS